MLRIVIRAIWAGQTDAVYMRFYVSYNGRLAFWASVGAEEGSGSLISNAYDEKFNNWPPEFPPKDDMRTTMCMQCSRLRTRH